MVDELSPEALERKLERGEEPQLIDVRQPAAFEQAHLPGAENVPMTELPTRIDEIEFDDEVVVTCKIGEASMQALRLIGSYEGANDSELWSLEGGIDGWDGAVETGESVDA